MKGHKVNLGRPGFWTGKKRGPIPEHVKMKMSVAQKKIGNKPPIKHGEEHPQWKGGSASYVAKHTFVQRLKGIAKECSNCGLQDKNTRRFNWANVSKKYKREASDYVSLCVSCHKKWDLGKIKVKTT